MFYPFASRPIYYGRYKLEMSLRLTLTFICYGIILPLSCLFTCYLAYKTIRVALMKHVWKFEISFLCYAFVEICMMLIIATSFALYYWTWGAYEYEEKYGTDTFVCLYYLYFFNHLPALFFNLANWTMVFMFVIFKRKEKKTLCCWKLSKFNVRTMYVVLVTSVTVDTMFLFTITWVTVITIDLQEQSNRCFVLLNPIFDTLHMTEYVKGIRWSTQGLLHIIPYVGSVSYLTMIVSIVQAKYHDHIHGNGLLIGEPEYFGGVIVTLTCTAMYILGNSFYLLFNDLYQFYLYIVSDPTDEALYFYVRMTTTVVRTVYFVLAPFQMLALFSVQENFQNTMLRYLNGTTVFNVDFQKTVGGDTKIKVHWDPLPDKLTWQARLYLEFLRCRPLVWLYEVFYKREERQIYEDKLKQRQDKENMILDEEIAQRKKKKTRSRKIRKIRNKEVRIQIDPVQEEGVQVAVVSLNWNPNLQETAV